MPLLHYVCQSCALRDLKNSSIKKALVTKIQISMSSNGRLQRCQLHQRVPAAGCGESLAVDGHCGPKFPDEASDVRAP
jgi:hypothetical protein